MLQRKDFQIVAQLRKNARMSLTMMSKHTGIPISTIYKKIQNYEKTIINKHATLLNFNILGYNTIAMIKLKVDREDKEKLGQHLKFNPSVNNAYKINNGYDYLIQGIFRQIKDLEEFMENLEQKFRILDKQTFFIIDNVKREEFMS